MRVIEAGVALTKMNDALRKALGDTVISCGLAGGLRHEHPTGTVLIPREVLRPSGEVLRCDPDLCDALTAAARALGLQPLTEALVTTATIVRGDERKAWADRGYAAVDMETGLIDARRIAAVRVMLDTPLRELSEEWLTPFRAMIKPRNWPEMFWLAREAPRHARLAARVVRAALD